MSICRGFIWRIITNISPKSGFLTGLRGAEWGIPEPRSQGAQWGSMSNAQVADSRPANFEKTHLYSELGEFIILEARGPQLGITIPQQLGKLTNRC